MQIRLHSIKAPDRFLPSCKWLGTVIDTAGNRGLLMELDGRYFSVRGGHAEPLDAMQVAQAMADAIDDSNSLPMRQRMVTLPDDLAEVAKRLGHGNLSAGIRKAIQVATRGEQ